MSFVEERFNTEIRYGMTGGTEFLTSVVTVNSGFEQRNAHWLDSRGAWEVGDDLYTRAETDYAIAFFRARRGKLEGFRFKDWSDFIVKQTNGIMVELYPYIYQLTKKYVAGGDPHLRTINKPVPNTVVIYGTDGLALTEGLDYTLDYTTGVLTMSLASSASHTIEVGTADIALATATPKISSSTEIVISIPPSKDLKITSWVPSYLSSAAMSWAGEFDVPVRFDTDKFNSTFEAYREDDGEALFSISGLNVIEIRV